MLVHLGGDLLVRENIFHAEGAQPTRGSFLVVMLPPILDYDSRFTQIQKPPPIQIFFSKVAVKTFNIAVLPRPAWIDVERLNVVISKPCLNLLRKEEALG